MEELKNIFLQHGFSESNANFLNEVIHTKFQGILIERLAMKNNEDIFAWFNNFAEYTKRMYEIYQGNKTTYLIHKFWFDELLTEVEKIDNDEEYVAFYSPVLVNKVDGVIQID